MTVLWQNFHDFVTNFIWGHLNIYYRESRYFETFSILSISETMNESLRATISCWVRSIGGLAGVSDMTQTRLKSQEWDTLYSAGMVDWWASPWFGSCPNFQSNGQWLYRHAGCSRLLLVQAHIPRTTDLATWLHTPWIKAALHLVSRGFIFVIRYVMIDISAYSRFERRDIFFRLKNLLIGTTSRDVKFRDENERSIK